MEVHGPGRALAYPSHHGKVQMTLRESISLWADKQGQLKLIYLIKQGEEKVPENYKRGKSATWRPSLKYISLCPASTGNRVIEI